MDIEIDKNWKKFSLNILGYTILLLVLSTIMFYKGALWECYELGNKAYKSNNFFGFECQKPKPYVNSYPDLINLNITFKND